MCEINPKRTHIFRFELFTAHEMTEERWQEFVREIGIKLLELEMEYNRTGEIRVHAHDGEEK